MFRRRMCVALLTAGVGTPGVVPEASAAAARGGGLRAEKLVLDSYESSADGAASPISTDRRLTRGRSYLLTVRGTISFYAEAEWLTPPPPLLICGRPEPRPLFTGPGQPAGQVGFDAETIFAEPTTAERCDAVSLPHRWNNFQVAAGAKFTHPRRLGLRTRRPNASHRYRYAVRGLGRRARFRRRLACCRQLRPAADRGAPPARCRLRHRRLRGAA